ncbi:hypothetical protein MUN89_18110 [Halobacillus salinarum]|uniref:Uncharacterized protein n=1 Tax=Halobacillus salinarum TaxID=2932257 RepID=A0ABY4EI02_9BACI|nr:hypothetical protein [Halobacillus salinarum]UOQ43774.1 hypothetical protein MUN89_18110 [Halobacillus salinarum]
MVQMNKKNKDLFNQYKDSMLRSRSLEEVQFNYNNLSHLLDGQKSENQSIIKKMKQDDLLLYKDLKEKMLAATDKYEVVYYENKIHKLLDKLDNNNDKIIT